VSNRLLTRAVLFVAIALLPAQELTDVQRKFLVTIDDALGVHSGAVIADIGTGSTLNHAIRIAEKAGPNGKMVCVDIKPSIIANINQKVAAQHIPNITAVLGKDDDPQLAPGTFDAILVSNTYHEFTDPAAMLKHIADALKPGGRLVVVELYANADKSEPRAEQAKHHDLSPDILEQELTTAGFVIKERPEPIRMDTDRFRYLFRAEKSK